jgi:hypothetical protein
MAKKIGDMVTQKKVHEAIYKHELGEFEIAIKELEEKLRGKRKNKVDQTKKEELEKKHSDWKKESRFKEYKRKAEALAVRFPDGAFFSQGKNISNTKFTNEQAFIYHVLIKLASTHGTWVNIWCNEGIEGLEKYGSYAIVEMYENIAENIYTMTQTEGWGKSPYIDQWLQVLDVELNYSISRRICNIVNKLELMKKEGLGINHQINIGSIVCQDGADTYYARYPYGPVPSALPQRVDPFSYEKFFTEEQFFAGIEELTDKYIDSVKIKSGEMLNWGLDYAKLAKSKCEDDNETNNQDEEEQIDEIEDMPEYEQRNKNLRKYVNSETPTVTSILEERKITKTQALDYLEYL